MNYSPVEVEYLQNEPGYYGFNPESRSGGVDLSDTRMFKDKIYKRDKRITRAERKEIREENRKLREELESK